MSYDFSTVKVLIVESSSDVFHLIKTVLTILDVPERNIEAAYEVDQAYVKFIRNQHDIIIADWLADPENGIKLIHKMRHNDDSPNIYVPVIMTAGSGHIKRVKKSIEGGVNDYLVKPFSAADLANRLIRLIEQPRLFVTCENYIGPDRRVNDEPYEGEERRINKLQAIDET